MIISKPFVFLENILEWHQTLREHFRMASNIIWRRKWQSTPVLLPGKSHGERNLVGYSPWGCKELDTTEQLHFLSFTFVSLTSLVAQMVKRLPTMWDTWVQSLGQEDLLEKEMATHSSILAWKIPWREEPGRLQSMGSQRVGHDWATSLSFSLLYICPWFLLQNNF